MKPGKQPGNDNNGSNAANWAMLTLRSITLTVEVFLHRDFGSRYIGAQGVVGLLVLLFFGAFVNVPGGDAMIPFMMLYLICCLAARIQILHRTLRGVDTVHTRYTGWPYLMRLFPQYSELKVKRLVEPALVLICGAVMTDFSPALGLYLLMAGAVLFLMVNHDEAEERRRLQNMQDSFIDANDRAERFRSMNDRR